MRKTETRHHPDAPPPHLCAAPRSWNPALPRSLSDDLSCQQLDKTVEKRGAATAPHVDAEDDGVDVRDRPVAQSFAPLLPRIGKQRKAYAGARKRERHLSIRAHDELFGRFTDCICVMEQGRIVERGNHDEPMSQRGRYWQLYTGGLELG